MPKVSIIIPTRNRTNTLIDSIKSVLSQNCNNYELIISDNSDDKSINYSAINNLIELKNNKQIRYIYPSKILSMADHWNFASEHASGDYIAILTDRFVMIQSAIKIIINYIDSNEETKDLLIWNVESNYNDLNQKLYIADCKFDFKKISTNTVLSSFLELDISNKNGIYFSDLPRGLNSIYRREYAIKIKNKYGRLFRSYSPDYTSAFMLTSCTKWIHKIDYPLYISHGNNSTGSNSHIFGLKTFMSNIDPIDEVPIKVDSVLNSVIYDFNEIKKLLYPKLNSFNYNKVNYFIALFHEINDKAKNGSPLNIIEMYKILNNNLSQYNEDQIIKINELINLYKLKVFNIFVIYYYKFKRLMNYFRYKLKKNLLNTFILNLDDNIQENNILECIIHVEEKIRSRI